MDENNIFYKITKGDIPSFTIYEDEDFRVILDISPSNPGHALILPKIPFEDIFHMPDSVAAKIMFLARKTAEALTSSLSCDGINLLQNNGAAAGQTVMYYHMHLIPRYEGDKLGLSWKPKEISKKELEELGEKISKHM